MIEHINICVELSKNYQLHSLLFTCIALGPILRQRASEAETGRQMRLRLGMFWLKPFLMRGIRELSVILMRPKYSG